MKFVKSWLVLIAALAGSGPVAAHHSFAMFDTSQRQTMRGTVKAFEWSAPHVWVWVAADDGHGNLKTYGFECVDPHALARWGGWSRQSLSAGDKVTVEWHPLKSGQDGGSLISITLGDGRVLKNFGPSQPQANGPSPPSAN